MSLINDFKTLEDIRVTFENTNCQVVIEASAGHFTTSKGNSIQLTLKQLFKSNVMDRYIAQW
jgi:hypothetical protein